MLTPRERPVPRRGAAGPRRAATALAALAALAGAGAQAQEPASVAPAPETATRAWSIEPSASISETFTDNRRLAATGRQIESITQLGAQVRVASRAGRVQGSLDYSLNGYAYARDSGADNLQNSLNAAGTAELVEQHVFVDAGATISQQIVSAFGTQSVDPALSNANQSEVSTFRLSPSVRGRTAGVARYEGRLNYSQTHSGSALGSSTNSGGTLSATSDGGARLGWSLALARQVADFSAGRRTTTDSANAGLSYAATPELKLSAGGGRERSDVTQVQSRGNATWNAGADWAPTERTRATARVEHHYFGNGHTLSFEHRLPRSAIRFSSTTDASSSAAATGASSFVTAYDLFFLQFASIEPDPVRRDALVRGFLQSIGISPAAQISTGFLTSGVTLRRNEQLSLSTQGVRTTLTFTLTRSRTTPLAAPTNPQDDLNQASVVRQTGFSFNAGHRLTAQSGLNLGLTQTRTSGTTAAQSTRLRSITAALTSTLGPRTSGALSLRHVESASATAPYTENAVIASLNLRF